MQIIFIFIYKNNMKYFTIKEYEYSDTARRLNLDNTIPHELLPNANRLLLFLDDVREKWTEYCNGNNGALIITSGYRCDKLNKIIGGVNNSAHKYCNAVDIIPKNKKINDFFNFFADYLKDKEFDTLLLEYSKSSKWVHFSIQHPNGKYRKIIQTIKN